MLNTRYTPGGRRNKRRPNWRQAVTVVVSLAMIAAFCTFGLRYMLVQDVVQAQPAPTPADTPVPTPEASPTPTPSAAATASAPMSPGDTARRSPTR